EVLAEAVLPSARPAEVFLYPSGLNYRDLSEQSIGKLLTEVATEAGKVADLRTRLQGRLTQPLGELSARVLLAHLALKAKDPAEALEVLKQFGERLEKDTQPNTVNAVVPILGAALERPDLAAAALPLLEKAAKTLGNSNAHESAQEILFRVARFHLDAKN